MSLLARILDGGTEKRLLTSSAAIPRPSEAYGSDVGEYVSDRTALQLTSVFACVRTLADSVALLPLDAYTKAGDVRRPIEPPPSLIRRPSSKLTTFEWLHQTVTSLALRGNAYHLVEARNALEFPTELLPLHPDTVQIDVDYDTGRAYYRVEGTRVPTADIVHIRRFTLPGAYVGLSPIEQARQGIGIGLAAERYGARYFRDAPHPPAVLESAEDVTDEQVERTQRSWVKTQGGNRLPAVTSGGLKYRQISVSPEEAQFLAVRKYERAEIASLYGVPPHMIGDTERSTSWGTGIEQQSIGYVRYSLQAWLSCIEEVLSDLLPRPQFAKFNVDALLRADTASRFTAYVQARNAGWLNVNEIRALEDRDPVEGGDEYLQPLNMGPLGSDPLAAQPEPAQEEPSNE